MIPNSSQLAPQVLISLAIHSSIHSPLYSAITEKHLTINLSTTDLAKVCTLTIDQWEEGISLHYVYSQFEQAM